MSWIRGLGRQVNTDGAAEGQDLRDTLSYEPSLQLPTSTPQVGPRRPPTAWLNQKCVIAQPLSASCIRLWASSEQLQGTMSPHTVSPLPGCSRTQCVSFFNHCLLVHNSKTPTITIVIGKPSNIHVGRIKLAGSITNRRWPIVDFPSRQYGTATNIVIPGANPHPREIRMAT